LKCRLITQRRIKSSSHLGFASSHSHGASAQCSRSKIRRLTVLTVHLVLPLEHIDDVPVRGGNGKPLKRLRNNDDVNTGLKPGENEIEDF
jgi:hypothetical protein